MSETTPLDLLALLIYNRLEGLSEIYHYHNRRHTEDVVNAAGRLAECEGLDASDRLVLLTAALLHDSGYLIGRENHEYYSCLMAKEILPECGYSSEQIRNICKAILATELPQKPETQLQALLCDADLDYFGREDFPEISHLLFLEMLETGQVKSLEEFNRRQLDFFETHRYFSTCSQRLRSDGKEKNYHQLIHNNNIDLNHE